MPPLIVITLIIRNGKMLFCHLIGKKMFKTWLKKTLIITQINPMIMNEFIECSP